MKKLVCFLLSLAMLMTILIPSGIATAAGSYNYAEALQKSIFFYEAQQAGPLPDWNRVEWRGDATMNDYVLGGWYDAGDHVKFNLPMAYTASMLGWALYEYGDGIEASGQRVHLENNLRFVLDYLVACDKGSSVVYQVGSGSGDHAWWGPVEVIEKEMERPYYTGKPTCVTAQMAAALAIGAKVLNNSTYLQHAKSLYALSDATRSDDGYSAASGFYNSWSGWKDELMWAAVWLYIATNDAKYLQEAEALVDQQNREGQLPVMKYKWAHCWDDVHYGAMLMLTKLTDKPEYHEFMKMHLDWWTVGYNGEKIKYAPGGLAWLDTWGSLRYANNTAFIASVYADFISDATLKSRYADFAKSQVDFALGSSGRSYVVGFGTNPPEHPHHRTAHGSWTDQLDNPPNHRHILYGALVGGPDSTGSYTDDIKNYITNEVATDYNAGFVGTLCKMVSQYGGTPLANFPAPEEKEDEFFVEGLINSNSGNDTGLKLLLNNRSAWPARLIKNLSYNYYVDISELVSAGFSASDVKVSTNYVESNMPATVSQLQPYSGNIYYVKVTYTDGTAIYPGGQSEFSAELQLRLTAPSGSGWDPTNDPSFKGLGSAAAVKTNAIPVYDGETLIFGQEPDGKTPPPPVSPTPSKTVPPTPSVVPTPTGIVYGDVNGDRAVNSIDFALMRMKLLGMDVDRFYSPAADVNVDGSFNSIDFAYMRQYLLGMIPALPVQR